MKSVDALRWLPALSLHTVLQLTAADTAAELTTAFPLLAGAAASPCSTLLPGDQDFQTVDLVGAFRVDRPRAGLATRVDGSRPLQVAYRIHDDANLTLPAEEVFPRGMPLQFSLTSTFRLRPSARWSRRGAGAETFHLLRAHSDDAELALAVVPRYRELRLSVRERSRGEVKNARFYSERLFSGGWHKVQTWLSGGRARAAVDCSPLGSAPLPVRHNFTNVSALSIVSAADGSPAKIDLQWLSLGCDQHNISEDTCDELPPASSVENLIVATASPLEHVGSTGAGRASVSRGSSADTACNGTCPPGPPGGRGERGEKGNTGFPGVPGSFGQRGAPGAAGFPGGKGDKGERGASGAPGVPGRAAPGGGSGARARGEKGEKGDAGEKGERGEAGAEGSPGRDGYQGPTGAAGVPGPRGERGPPGTSPAAVGDNITVSRGLKGERGLPGPDGAPGHRGPPGIAGPTGAHGEPGASGAAGRDGAAGQPGGDGPQGPEGPPGPPGPPGPQGPLGPVRGELAVPSAPAQAGPAGDKGERGAEGPAGAPGRDGADGVPGAPGPRGAPGPASDARTLYSQPQSTSEAEIRSICEAVLRDRLSEVVAGLVGPPGPPGTAMRGRPGRRGAPGPPGAPGEAGEGGPRGWRGAAGARGPAGALGERGERGEKGERGAEGRGTEGPEGPRGLPGPTGAPGQRGNAGERGEPGRTGVAGKEGPRGAPGTCECPPPTYLAYASSAAYPGHGTNKGP